MSKTGWKGLERNVAKDFNTIRILRKGESVSDVEVNIIDNKKNENKLIIECKNRNSINIIESLNQAIGYKENESQIACVVFLKSGAKKKEVYITIQDFLKVVRYKKNDFSFYLKMDYDIFKKMIKTVGE